MADPNSTDPALPDATPVPERAVMPWQEQPDPFKRTDQAARPSPCHAIQPKPLPPGTFPCAKPGIADPTSLAPILLTIAAGICLGAGAVIVRSKGRVPAARRGSRTAQRAALRWRIAAGVLILTGLVCLALIATVNLPLA